MGSHGVRTPRFADGVAALVAPPLVAPPPVALLPVVPPLAGIVRSKFPPRVGTQLGWASNPLPAVMCVAPWRRSLELMRLEAPATPLKMASPPARVRGSLKMI